MTRDAARHDVLGKLAVIVPVAPGDPEWRQLLDQLRALPAGAEVILAGPRRPADFVAGEAGGVALRWVETEIGRARQLNAAARLTGKTFLWFLHADTALGDDALGALGRALETSPSRVHYFHLAFLDDGPPRWLMSFNTLGAWLRSQWLGLPYGDQSYCLARADFERLGGFDESHDVGEDLFFVWKARREGLRLHCVGATLRTSARKYAERGWWRTTGYHVGFSILKSVPELLRLVRHRYLRRLGSSR